MRLNEASGEEDEEHLDAADGDGREQQRGELILGRLRLL